MTTKAQSSSDKWRPGYGNGPDNSRYFASKQINKSNVNQLQVAWTYPYSDTGGYRIVVRGVIYGRGRNGSLIAVDAKNGNGTPGTTNSLVLTESGLVFGAGGANQVRAWDSETGKQLWSSRFGGSFLCSLVMYEMDGRLYLIVPAASSAGGRGRGGAPAAEPAGTPARLAGSPRCCLPNSGDRAGGTTPSQHLPLGH